MIPKVPWLTRTTLRPFRCLCYHQRQLLLFLIHTHGGKSSIFYVCLWNFYLLGPEKYTVTIYLNENTSLYLFKGCMQPRVTSETTSLCNSNSVPKNYLVLSQSFHQTYIYMNSRKYQKKKKSKSLKIPNSIWTMLKAFIDFCVKGIIDDVKTQSVAYLFCGNNDIRIIGIVF